MRRILDEHGNFVDVSQRSQQDPRDREIAIMKEQIANYKKGIEQKSSEIRSLKSMINERDPKKTQEYVDLERVHNKMNDQFQVLLLIEKKYNELQAAYKELEKENKDLLSMVNELKKGEEKSKKAAKANVSKAKNK